MTTLLSFIRDADGEHDLFAVVADETHAEYVWPENGVQLFESVEARIAELTEDGDGSFTPPTDPQEWIDLATHSIGFKVITPPVEHEDWEEAVDAADEALNYEYEDEVAKPHPTTRGDQMAKVGAAFDRVVSKNPDFALTIGPDDDIDAESFEEFILEAMGGVENIDPAGPNGWLRRAVLKEDPLPGDENGVVNFATSYVASDGE